MHRFGPYVASTEGTISEFTEDKIGGSMQYPKGCDVEHWGHWGVAHVYDKNFNRLPPGSVNPYRIYDFPLDVGKTWSQTFDTSYGTSNWQYRTTGRIVGLEKVAVPAGTFDAYKIVIDLKYSGSSNSGGFNQSGSIEDTLWYAPQVKSYVKRVSVNSERCCLSHCFVIHRHVSA